MNKRLEYRAKLIEESMAVVAEELGVDRKAAYRYAFELGRAYAGACADACVGGRAGVSTRVRTGAYARVLNSNSININTSVCETSAAEAVTHTQPISLGGLFRQLPKRVPESYALWWWRSMKERFFGKAFPRQEETAAECGF